MKACIAIIDRSMSPIMVFTPCLNTISAEVSNAVYKPSIGMPTSTDIAVTRSLDLRVSRSSVCHIAVRGERSCDIAVNGCTKQPESQLRAVRAGVCTLKSALDICRCIIASAGMLKIHSAVYSGLL